MKNFNSNLFTTRINFENNYYRLHVTSPKFKGRIRKRFGDKSVEELEDISFDLRSKLVSQYKNKDFSKEDVSAFIDNYNSLHVKGNASVMEYTDEFLSYMKNKFNKKTRKPLSKSTLSGYRTAIKYFNQYLLKKKILPNPANITEDLLNGFYNFLNGGHNYKAKLHTKIKGYIKYLIEIKRINIDSNYNLSAFSEEYDNQFPDENDIALTQDEVKKLIILRKKLKKGDVQFHKSTNTKTPEVLRELQFNVKKENLVKCLDCYLLMIGTGMYHSDVDKSKLLFSNSGSIPHIRYRRAKNNSLCKAIPFKNDDVFIVEEIIKEYRIKNNSNFPLNLSLTHFNNHLERIRELAGIDHKLTNKMARKTFASQMYFSKRLPIHYVQILLGHKDVKHTFHYLRIDDNDIAEEIFNF